MFYCVTDNELHKFCCATETATMNAKNKMSAAGEEPKICTIRMERTNVVKNFGFRLSDLTEKWNQDKARIKRNSLVD